MQKSDLTLQQAHQGINGGFIKIIRLFPFVVSLPNHRKTFARGSIIFICILFNIFSICFANEQYEKEILFTTRAGSEKHELGYSSGFKFPIYPKRMIVDENDKTIWVFDFVNNAIKSFDYKGDIKNLCKVDSYGRASLFDFRPVETEFFPKNDFCLFNEYIVVLNSGKSVLRFINKKKKNSYDLNFKCNHEKFASIATDQKDIFINTWEKSYDQMTKKNILIKNPLYTDPFQNETDFSFIPNGYITNNGLIYKLDGLHCFKIVDIYDNKIKSFCVQDRSGTEIIGADKLGNVYYIKSQKIKETKGNILFLAKCDTSGQLLSKIDIDLNYTLFFVAPSGNVYCLVSTKDPKEGMTYQVIKYKNSEFL